MNLNLLVALVVVSGREPLKFAPETIDNLVVGYGTNSHSYIFYNKSNISIVESSDVKFDASNGSQVEQVHLNDLVDNNHSQAIKGESLGDILISSNPMEEKVFASSSRQVKSCTPPRPNINYKSKDRFIIKIKDKLNVDLKYQVMRMINLLISLCATLQPRNVTLNNTIGSLSNGVSTNSRLVKFCEHRALFRMLNLLRQTRLWKIRNGWMQCTESSITSPTPSVGHL